MMSCSLPPPNHHGPQWWGSSKGLHQAHYPAVSSTAFRGLLSRQTSCPPYVLSTGIWVFVSHSAVPLLKDQRLCWFCVSFPSQLICSQNRPCSNAAKQQVALKSLFLTLYYFHLYCCLYKQVLCMPSLHPSYSTFIFLHINGMRNHSEFLVQAR